MKLKKLFLISASCTV